MRSDQCRANIAAPPGSNSRFKPSSCTAAAAAAAAAAVSDQCRDFDAGARPVVGRRRLTAAGPVERLLLLLLVVVEAVGALGDGCWLEPAQNPGLGVQILELLLDGVDATHGDSHRLHDLNF